MPTPGFPALRLPVLVVILAALFWIAPVGAGAKAWAAGEPAGGEERFNFSKLFGDLFPRTGTLTMTGEELRGLGCLTTSVGIGSLAVLFGGTAMLVSGSPGASTGVIALPVLAATMWAGCAFGSTAAPGAAWLARNWTALFPLLPNP